MSMRSLLDEQADIERATATTASDGTVSSSWSVVAEDVPCSIQERDAASSMTDAGQSLRTRATLYLPADTDIRPRRAEAASDRVVVDGVAWRVESVAAAIGGDHLLVADLILET